MLRLNELGLISYCLVLFYAPYKNHYLKNSCNCCIHPIHIILIINYINRMNIFRFKFNEKFHKGLQLLFHLSHLKLLLQLPLFHIHYSNLQACSLILIIQLTDSHTYF